ncbi:MAG: carboxypeptidase-like regulatory domain-containing protein [Planctomycetaceae bacterium]|nr:carboxypeptidase-like regulatory domain-containing protein [Planctomycetaceae bacterium]
MIRISISLGLILLLIGIAGCTPRGKGLKVEYVEGVVTLDGNPVPSASVTFVPIVDAEGAEAAGGYTNEQGVYKLTSGNGDPEKGALAGEYRVLVSKIEAKDLSEGQEYGTATGYNVSWSQTQLLPTIYQDRSKSPLTATVNKGKNKIPLELTKNP